LSQNEPYHFFFSQVLIDVKEKGGGENLIMS